MQDKQAIQRIKNGEIEYFSHIVKTYTKVLVAYVRRVVYDHHDGDDIVQNAFIQFYKHIELYDEERPVLPYLYQITKNEIRMYLRSRKNTLSLNEEIKVAHSPDLDVTDDVSELLDSLHEDQKKALQLYSEGYSYKEVSNELKKPINTIRTLIRRARLSLLQKYGKTRR